jgi:hypothetical protein
LFQTFFKSVGPRTYAAQIKRARNGNHYLVLTEGKRGTDSDVVNKTRLYVFSEDFTAFFNLMRDSATWIKANPLPPKVAARRQAFWKKRSTEPSVPSASALPAQAGGGSPIDAARPTVDRSAVHRSGRTRRPTAIAR